MEYISIKKVTAVPADRDGERGMELTYMDGYKSWCPLDVFERDYLHMSRTTLLERVEFLSAALRSLKKVVEA